MYTCITCIYIYIYTYLCSSLRSISCSKPFLMLAARLPYEVWLVYRRLVTSFCGVMIVASCRTMSRHQVMEVSPDTPDATTKPRCYGLTNILVPRFPGTWSREVGSRNATQQQLSTSNIHHQTHRTNRR